MTRSFFHFIKKFGLGSCVFYFWVTCVYSAAKSTTQAGDIPVTIAEQHFHSHGGAMTAAAVNFIRRFH